MRKPYVNLSLKQLLVLQWRKHLFGNDNPLEPSENKIDVVELSRRLLGIHAARPISPYVIALARNRGLRFCDFNAEHTQSRNLLLLRCMRKTLHLVTPEQAPIVHKSTLNLRLSECRSRQKKLDLSDARMHQIQHTLLSLLVSSPLRPREIEKQLAGQKVSPKEIRIMLKDLWERGLVLCQNLSTTWGKEDRVYGLMSSLVPALNLNSITEEEATLRLFELYILRNGPATARDASWWSGLSKGMTQKALDQLMEKGQVVQVSVETFPQNFFVAKEDLMKPLQNIDHDWIRLLGHEDTSLKAYNESRSRYIDTFMYDRLFNSIGEARPSICYNGRIVGTWFWNNSEFRIETQLFPTAKVDKDLLEEEIAVTQEALTPSYRQLRLHFK